MLFTSWCRIPFASNRDTFLSTTGARLPVLVEWLPFSHCWDSVFRPLGQDKVVGGRRSAVDPPIALLQATGVPRHVEVEQVASDFLQVLSRAASVAMRMRADGEMGLR